MILKGNVEYIDKGFIHIKAKTETLLGNEI